MFFSETDHGYHGLATMAGNHRPGWSDAQIIGRELGGYVRIQ